MTLDAFVDRLYDGLSLKLTDSLSGLRQIAVEQLRELSIHRTLWMEGTATFTTEAERTSYDENWPGIPAGIQSIDRMWYTQGLANFPIRGPIPLDELRFNFPAAVSRNYPEAFSFHAGKLLLTSVSSAVEVSFDFFRDARRDSVTGQEISDSPFTADAENPWLETEGGGLILRNAVLAEYFSREKSQNPTQAEIHRGLRNLHLGTAKNEYHALKVRGGMQVPAYLGGLLDYGTHVPDFWG